MKEVLLEHFSVKKEGKKTVHYFLCPISQECGGFYEFGGHLTCESCGAHIEEEAIKKGICDDNRK